MWGDGVQLQQVLLNLIMNGIHAMAAATEGRRELTVSVAHAEPRRVLVAVEDTGPIDSQNFCWDQRALPHALQQRHRLALAHPVVRHGRLDKFYRSVENYPHWSAPCQAGWLRPRTRLWLPRDYEGIALKYHYRAWSDVASGWCSPVARSIEGRDTMPDTHVLAERPGQDQIATYDAIVIGAGISGMFMLYRLRELGMTARVFEAGTNVGGTWYWNRYPGARFDSESWTYGYSFSKELMQDWDWKEHFSPNSDTLEVYAEPRRRQVRPAPGSAVLQHSHGGALG